MRNPFLLRNGAILLGILIFSGTVSPQSGGNPDSVIARVWLERAAVLLNAENPDNIVLNEAAFALNTAAEFRSPGRDALYLEAKLLLKGYRKEPDIPGESATRRGYLLLGKSLDDHTPGSSSDITRFEDRAVLWSSQALRLKEFRDLLDRYQSWPRGNRDDPVLIYAAARAALYLGLEEQAADLAVRGEALTVPGTDLGRLGPSFIGGAQPAFRALAVAAKDSNSISTLDAAWRRWGIGMEETLRPWLLSGHIKFSDTGNLMNLLSSDMVKAVLLMTNPGDSDMDIHEDFSCDLALFRRIRSAVPESRKVLTDSLLEDYTGLLLADADYDGYPEEFLRFVNGKPDYRKIDKNQDGCFEWYIIYNGYDPWHIQFDDGNLGIIYEQGAYPSVLSMNRRNDDSRIELFMHPGGFSWEAENSGGFWTDPSEPDWNEDQLWFGTRRVNITVNGLDSNTVGESITYLAEGYPLRAVERLSVEDVPGKPLWTREIIYDDGVAAAGRRSYRMDPDNPGQYLWELYERFENGEMVGLAWDPGMTGTPSYLRDWALERYLETQVWDLDADRWIDVRRFVFPGAKVMSKEILITEARQEDLIPWITADWAPWEQ